MRSFIQDIQTRFKGFMSSSCASTVLVACEAEDSPLLLKSLDALEQDPDVSDILLTFGHAFEDLDGYVRQILDSIRQQLVHVNEALTKRGDSALAPFPSVLEDEALLPAIKLRDTVQYIRGIVPRDRRIVWIMYPLEINQPEQYLQLIDYLRGQLEDDSLRGTKLIVRDSVVSPVLVPELEGQPNVDIYRPELNLAAMEKKLNEKANDPRVPAEEQAQMHMMLAGFDVANKRYAQALARNLELLGYFRHIGQRHQQSIVLNNIGDLHYIQGRFAEAQEWYERAIGLSLELQSQPFVLYQSMNLGHALFMQQRFDEALIYYRAAEQLAQASSTPIYRIQALERIGIIKREQGHLDEAAQAWEKAVECSQTFEYELGEQANLEHLWAVYNELGDVERLEACEAALSKLTPHSLEHDHG
jgi:tetratricopeptide (TPR) repeat protein